LWRSRSSRGRASSVPLKPPARLPRQPSSIFAQPCSSRQNSVPWPRLWQASLMLGLCPVADRRDRAHPCHDAVRHRSVPLCCCSLASTMPGIRRLWLRLCQQKHTSHTLHSSTPPQGMKATNGTNHTAHRHRGGWHRRSGPPHSPCRMQASRARSTRRQTAWGTYALPILPPGKMARSASGVASSSILEQRARAVEQAGG
jgi:hypothetical protein